MGCGAAAIVTLWLALATPAASVGTSGREGLVTVSPDGSNSALFEERATSDSESENTARSPPEQFEGLHSAEDAEFQEVTPLERVPRRVKVDDELAGTELLRGLPAAGCPFAAATANGSCLAFTSLAQLPVAVWPVRSSNHEQTIFVATPGHNVTAAQTTCAHFVSVAEAPAFQQSIEGHTCYALGNLMSGCPTAALIDPRNASAGLLLSYTGGSPTNGRARALRYRLVCDPSAPASAGPTAEAQVGPQGPSSPFAFSLFRTRITTCYACRVEAGPYISYRD